MLREGGSGWGRSRWQLLWVFREIAQDCVFLEEQEEQWEGWEEVSYFIILLRADLKSNNKNDNPPPNPGPLQNFI